MCRERCHDCAPTPLKLVDAGSCHCAVVDHFGIAVVSGCQPPEVKKKVRAAQFKSEIRMDCSFHDYSTFDGASYSETDKTGS